MNERKRTIGEAFRKLDAGEEHAGQGWARLLQMLGKEYVSFDDQQHKLEVGSIEYTIAAAFSYAEEARRILMEHVPPDWQLCPYQDCCWGCGVESEGDFICPHCGRHFRAEYSDSNYEDTKFSKIAPDEVYGTVMLAFDFGPSWATPDSA